MTEPAGIPRTIRATRIHAFGGPEQLRIEEIAAPSPAPGEVLVRVAAAGLNPLDFKIRDGSSPRAAKLDLPAVLGREMAGTVIGAANDVDLDSLGMPVGTAVFGMRSLSDVRGTYAQIVAIAAADLAPVPSTDAAPEALVPFAGLALAGLTALSVLDKARIADGDSVLIHGGSGGVGQLLIPLALEAGAGRVWATGRGANADRIAELGATPIAYDQVDWESTIDEATEGRGVDIVLDTHYVETFEPSLAHLADGGRIVVLPSLADLTPATERGIEAHLPSLTVSRAALDRLAAGVADGTLPLEVGEVLALEEVARGHEHLETGHTRGKIVLSL